MKTKHVTFAVLALMLMPLVTPEAHASAVRASGASLFLPTTGQAMNGQLGNTKTKLMAVAEVGLVTTTAILGGVVGGPVVWVALGPLIANHVWSATDAYMNARNQAASPVVEQQVMDAQRALELSRQRRFDREETYQSSLRERINQAALAAR